MRRHNFKKLQIWQLAIELIDENYKLTSTFPDYEKYGLRTQMNRCSVSIASNISEGSSKRTDKHFMKFLITCVITMKFVYYKFTKSLLYHGFFAKGSC